MQIGDRIAQRRKELGLTQGELAEKMGYKSKAAISKIETNVNDITQSTVVKFAEALDTSISFLMGWDNTTPAPQIILSSSEEELVGCYRSMNAEGQTAALAAVRGLAASGIYKKRDDPAGLLDLG